MPDIFCMMSLLSYLTCDMRSCFLHIFKVIFSDIWIDILDNHISFSIFSYLSIKYKLAFFKSLLLHTKKK